MKTELDKLIRRLRIKAAGLSEIDSTRKSLGPASRVSRGGAPASINPGAGRSGGGPYLGQGWDLTGTVPPTGAQGSAFLTMLQGISPAAAIAVAAIIGTGMTLGSVLSPSELESIAPSVNRFIEDADPASLPSGADVNSAKGAIIYELSGLSPSEKCAFLRQRYSDVMDNRDPYFEEPGLDHQYPDGSFGVNPGVFPAKTIHPLSTGNTYGHDAVAYLVALDELMKKFGCS